MAQQEKKVKAAGGGIGGQAAYPFQLIAILVLFGVFIAGYIYFTSGEDAGTAETQPAQTQEQSAESG